jgi:hypothetical protein
MYGEHDWLSCMTHTPLPSQIWPDTLPPMHDVGPQLVPLGAFAHDAVVPELTPLHAASWPQLLAVSRVQRLPGFEPAFAGPQVPPPVPLVLFAAAHASHVLLHALSQQTPSAQYPLVHWSLALHVVPRGAFPTQTPPVQ